MEHYSSSAGNFAGVWCVEGMLEGEINVTQYDLVEEQAKRCHFEAQDTVRAEVGTSGCLIPPFEYHTIANAQEQATSVTMHVYGEELKQCAIFEGGEDGWYERRIKNLGYS